MLAPIVVSMTGMALPILAGLWLTPRREQPAVVLARPRRAAVGRHWLLLRSPRTRPALRVAALPARLH